MGKAGLAVILAAGEGTRMRSGRAKVLHPVAGLPMIAHVMAGAAAAGLDGLAVVVGRDGEAVAAEATARAADARVFEQAERRGTAHAVLAAREAIAALPAGAPVAVLFGDTPLVRPETVASVARLAGAGAAVAVLGFEPDDPTGYGRLLVDGDRLLAIREERDASEAEKAVRLCNSGIMALEASVALALLDAVGDDNARGEFYLTDVVEIANARGLPVAFSVAAEAQEVMGVNDRVQLAAAEAAFQDRARRAAMTGGATLVAPETVFLSHDTRLGEDVVVEPHVFFGPGVVVGAGARVKAFSHLEGCVLAPGAEVGPYARLRPGTRVAGGARIGNFVEVKNAVVEEGAKVSHLSYIGDGRVGAGANVGAGTITCNYDGGAKHFTDIGPGAFIGSNSALVAPVTIGERAYVASGSVIVEDVAPGALAIARGRQVEKPGRSKLKPAAQ